MYKLNVLIKQYSIFSPTVNAVFEGNVHGVVVHARTKILEYFFKKSGTDSSIHSNCAVTVVSVIS